MDKYEIAQIFREIALRLELTDPNPKKGIAYRKAATSIEMAQDIDLLAKNQLLETLHGVGKEIARMTLTLLQRGSLPYHEHLKKEVPDTILELANISGIGKTRLRRLYQDFNIKSLDDLKNALEERKLHGVKGFGPSFIGRLEKKIQQIEVEENTLLYPRALYLSYAIKESLQEFAQTVEIGGPLRRACELIDELSFIVTTKDAQVCLTKFLSHTFVQRVLSIQNKGAVVLLKQGIKASLEIVEEDELPYTLLIKTGSKTHLEALEREAISQGYFLNRELGNGLKESAIYQKLGLHDIPPELREGYGEIEEAKHHGFSHLINESDLTGTFHCHTTDSDGVNTIEEMAEAARKRGWHYIGISDHSQSSYQANGLSEERLAEQIATIKQLNRKYGKNFRIFAGIESDILEDGQLDVSESLLKQLDFVIISIHRRFKQGEEAMTNRLIRAIENPYTTIVGHLTGRLLRSRDPCPLDIPRVINACAAHGKVIEINGSPSRLEMDWRYWVKFRDRGLKCSINPDAHSIEELNNCAYAVNIARKGWLTKTSVINTLSLKEMVLLLEK